MPKAKDIAEKELEKKNDVFADIVNTFIFNGETVVRPEELVDVSPTSKLILSDGLHEQERDVAKLWKRDGGNVILALYGFENQTMPDPDIALRCFAYDGASYKEQVNQHKARGAKPLPPYPVVTLVLYFGTEPWNAPKSLFERLGANLPDSLRPYLNDYKVNLVEVAKLSREEISKLRSDFQLVAKQLSPDAENRDGAFQNRPIDHPEELFTMLSALTGNSMYVENFFSEKRQKEAVTMVDILAEAAQRAKLEGERIGKERSEYAAAVKLLRLGTPMETIEKVYPDLSPEDLKRALDESKLPQ